MVLEERFSAPFHPCPSVFCSYGNLSRSGPLWQTALLCLELVLVTFFSKPPQSLPGVFVFVFSSVSLTPL